MDPQLVQGLREAKQLLDEGILTQREFEEQKEFLLCKYARNDKEKEVEKMEPASIVQRPASTGKLMRTIVSAFPF